MDQNNSFAIQQTPRAISGISLLEVMISALILAVLALTSLPDLRGANDRTKLHRAALVTEQVLGEAALRAQTLGRATTAELLTAEVNGQKTLQWRLESSVAYLPTGVSAFGSFALERELSMPQTDDDALSRVAFYPTGAASPGSLTLVSGRERCKVVQPLRGALRSECRK